MPVDLGPYDHYVFAVLAFVGTLLGAGFLLWFAQESRFAGWVRLYRGVAPNFLSIVGVMFALNLVFLANDTWHAHDRALDAVFQEASGLDSVLVVAGQLPDPIRSQVVDAVRNYAEVTVKADWPALARRQSSPEASAQLDALLALISSREVAQALDRGVYAQLLQQVQLVRTNRVVRVAVSQTHVNPLKWLGMAFLGFLMMVSLVVVHVDQPRAELMAVMLFAAAAAPTAAIVLVQGNPFQPPLIVSAAPIAALAGR